MRAIRFRAAIWLRRRWPSAVLTALVIGLLGGLAMGIVAGTRRTSSAPDRFTEQAGGDPDLQIIQQGGSPLIDEIASLPGVASAEGIAFVLSFPLSPEDGSPLTDLNPFAGTDTVLGARVVEGRFTDPENANEFTVNRPLAAELASRFGTKVGDSFEIASFSRSQLRSDLDFSVAKPEVPPFEATLVGVTEAPSEFDESGTQLVFSRAFLVEHADVGVIQTLIAADLDGATPEEVLDQVRQKPDGADSYSVPLRVVSDSARRAVRFQVVALWLVSALAVLAAVVVTAQVAGRALRLSEDERRSMHALGWTRRELGTERALEGAAIGLGAAVVAAVVAYAVSAAFPLGVLRDFEPDRGARLDWVVTGIGMVVAVLVTAGAGAVLGVRRRAVRRAGTTATPVGAFGMPLSVGLHFATVNRRGRRNWASSVVGAIGVAGLVGAAVAGMSLTTIVEHPDRWGVNFDQIFGNPYAPAEQDIVTPLLGIADVTGVTGANIGAVNVDGTDVPTIGFAVAKGNLVPTIIDGREPRRDGEIALGGEVTRRLGVDIGDTVDVGGSSGETRPFEVVGVVVTPDSAGNGAALTFDAFASLNPGSTQNVVMVDFRDGPSDDAVGEVTEAIYSPPDSLTTPTTIRALERVTAAPFLLCVVFAIMLLVSGAYLLTASVRTRWLDIATLRALGSVRGQIRSVVHWQSSVASIVMAFVGVPIGVLLGQRVVDAIVSNLGIVPGSGVAWPWIALGVAAPIALANLIALAPARRATSAPPALLTR